MNYTTQGVLYAQQDGIKKIDLEQQFKTLSNLVLGEGSPYLRMKDSLLTYLDNTSISTREKSELLSKFSSDVVNNFTNKLLDMAFQIEVSNRNAPYELGKLVEDARQTVVQTNKLDKDIQRADSEKALVDTQTDKMKADIYSTVASTYSKTGYNNTLIEDYANLTTQSDSLDKKTVEKLDIEVYSTKVGTKAKFGGIPNNLNNVTVDLTGSLTEAELAVTRRQEKAFDDENDRIAMQSLASTIGLMLSSGNGDLLAGSVTIDGIATNVNLLEEYTSAAHRYLLTINA